MQAAQFTDPDALCHWSERLSEPGAQRIEHDLRKHPVTKLSEAQFLVARSYGFGSWPKFASHVEAVAKVGSPLSSFESAVDAIIDGNTEMLATLLNHDPSLITARSTREHRGTLLHYVAANGVEDFREKTPATIVAITRVLLDSGAIRTPSPAPTADVPLLSR